MAPRRIRSTVTYERLIELLEYDPITGLFRWRVTNSPRAQAGAIAGYTDKRGYVWIGIDGIVYLAHRLAWLYMAGEMPKEVDHRDLDKSNNRWRNLRRATRSQNSANRHAGQHSLTGVRGVSLASDGRRRPYEAYIGEAGRKKHIGYYATLQEAIAARNAAALSAHGEFARRE